MPDTLHLSVDAESQSGAPCLRPMPSAAVLGRAAAVAVGLGTILRLVYRGGALFGPEALRLLALVLVYVTPFVVVTVAQVLGLRRASLERARGGSRGPHRETFVATALGHGIPLRALLLGLLVGTFNGALLIGVACVEDGHLGAVPWPLMGQAIPYRRAAGAGRVRRRPAQTRGS